MSSKPLSKQLSGTIDPSGRPLARTSEGPVTGSFHSQSEFSRSVAPKDIFQVISPDLSMVGVCSPSLSLWVLKQVDNMGGWYVYVCICSLSLSLSLCWNTSTHNAMKCLQSSFETVLICRCYLGSAHPCGRKKNAQRPSNNRGSKTWPQKNRVEHKQRRKERYTLTDEHER